MSETTDPADVSPADAPPTYVAPAEGKSGGRLVPAQYLYAFVLVTLLFPLWGFANDVTNPMVKAFQEIFQIKAGQASYIQFAFYGGYFTMAIPAALAIRKISYKGGILIGLGLYATGALLFIPASIMMEFWLFCASLYILTFGLAFLETSANPYILSMGPKETATQRLNLAQAFNPLGSLTGMFVTSLLILPALQVSDFREQQVEAHPEYKKMKPAEVDGEITAALKQFSVDEPERFGEMQSYDLQQVRKPYVVIAIVVICLAAVFAFSKMPDTGHKEEPIHLSQVLANLTTLRYLGGVIAQTFYVGAQIMCWTYILHYGMTMLGMSAGEAQGWNIRAMITFVSCRFIGTFLLRFINSGLLLGVLAVGGVFATAGVMFLEGMAGMYCLVGVSACMSIMFPTIYGIALDGLSADDAKLGSAGLIVAIVGGAFMPLWNGRLIDGPSRVLLGQSLESVQFAFILSLGCFVVVAIYGFLVFAMESRRGATT
ncbi:L-fucose-proton symporter [Pseudobythopirellula maris]|uniref:L-fucose-proton symporter n=1 Tax=Pseudobythopirellula maris TaxID=2527991 RepID=A0A5C5ZXT4_9BACT|nr:L-fucose:H+ symporter permease [Pseudobythopirellula maris]TWT91083.1 L-fucose-proton symporter [Pseudobythopirellula maris]